MTHHYLPFVPTEPMHPTRKSWQVIDGDMVNFFVLYCIDRHESEHRIHITHIYTSTATRVSIETEDNSSLPSALYSAH